MTCYIATRVFGKAVNLIRRTVMVYPLPTRGRGQDLGGLTIVICVRQFDTSVGDVDVSRIFPNVGPRLDLGLATGNDDIAVRCNLFTALPNAFRNGTRFPQHAMSERDGILCACVVFFPVDFCGGEHAMSDRDVIFPAMHDVGPRYPRFILSAKDFRAFRAFRGQ